MLQKFETKIDLPIVTVETLIRAAKALFQATNLAEKHTQESVKEREALLSQLWLNVNSLNKILFPTSSTQPQLSAPELLEAYEQLEKLLKIFEGMVGDIIKFQKTHQEEMSYWSEERKFERDLFIYFFTEPDKLIKMYEDLITRAEARSIQSGT